MAKFSVYASANISVFAVVEAETAEQAKEWAENNLGMPGLCHQCSSAGASSDGEASEEWALSDGVESEAVVLEVHPK